MFLCDCWSCLKCCVKIIKSHFDVFVGQINESPDAIEPNKIIPSTNTQDWKNKMVDNAFVRNPNLNDEQKKQLDKLRQP